MASDWILMLVNNKFSRQSLDSPGRPELMGSLCWSMQPGATAHRAERLLVMAYRYSHGGKLRCFGNSEHWTPPKW